MSDFSGPVSPLDGPSFRAYVLVVAGYIAVHPRLDQRDDRGSHKSRDPNFSIDLSQELDTVISPQLRKLFNASIVVDYTVIIRVKCTPYLC